MVMPSLTSTNMHRMTRQLQDRSGGMTAPWGNLPRRFKPDDAFVPITLRRVLPYGNISQELVPQS